MLRSAEAHYTRQQRLIALAIAAVRRAFGMGDPRRAVPLLTEIQREAARDGASSVRQMLAEQRITVPPRATVNTDALAGVASDGRSLLRLVVAGGDDLYGLETIAHTQVKDASRVAAGLEITNRPGVGWIRMVNPPACSRCIILAGKWFGWNDGFERHPNCDCVHIPTNEDSPHDLVTNPHDYFDSMTPAQQDKAFTKDGAQAIRDGADINQVVNARRGASGLSRAGARLTDAEQRMLRGGRDVGRLERVDVYGRQVFITREGITVRGHANRTAGRGGRRTRLMPESIYEVADDQEDAVRMLKAHGYFI